MLRPAEVAANERGGSYNLLFDYMRATPFDRSPPSTPLSAPLALRGQVCHIFVQLPGQLPLGALRLTLLFRYHMPTLLTAVPCHHGHRSRWQQPHASMAPGDLHEHEPRQSVYGCPSAIDPRGAGPWCSRDSSLP